MVRVLSVLLVLVLSSCDSSDDPEVSPFGPLLSNIATNVITATYDDYSEAATELRLAVTEYAGSSTPSNLNAARNAWVAARAPWEASEGFLIGPVATQGLAGAMDTWPITQADLDEVMARPVVLSVDYVAGLPGNQKGFHTIEFLLYGADGEKEPLDFTQREIAYLVAATEVLKDDAETLLEAWVAGGGNYAANLAGAGGAGSTYPSEQAAVREIVQSMIALADALANSKIETPLATQNVFGAESRFSQNSTNDFVNNIRGIRNVYTGDYGNIGGEGVAEFIAQQDEALNLRFLDELSTAETALASIPDSFQEAIVANPDLVVVAQVAVLAVHETLENQIAPLIMN